MDKVNQPFFEQPAIELAPKLLGKILVRRFRGREYRARMAETEAYIGEHDLAAHASKGRTSRTEVMFGPGGRAYVYLIYGMYAMLNFVAAPADDPQAVLIRAADPLDGWVANLSGPGKLTRALRITVADYGRDLTGDKLFVLNDPTYTPKIVATKRVGVDYAGEWKDALLRFVDLNSPAISKPRPQ